MEDTIEIQNDSKYGLTVISSENRLTARLTVRNLGDDNSSGVYWCQGILDDGTILDKHSSILDLKTMDEYTSTIPCILDIFLKSSSMKCITLTTPTTSQDNNTSSATTVDHEVTVGILRNMTVSTTPPTSLFFNTTLIIVTTLTSLLFIVCIVLTIVIGTQCKRREMAKSELIT